MATVARPPLPLPSAHLESLFEDLVRRWKEERGPTSSRTELAMCTSYQRIIGLGPAVRPLLLRALEQAPDQWFWALKAITGADPVPPPHRGKMREMALDWITLDGHKGTSGDTDTTAAMPYTVTSPAEV